MKKYLPILLFAIIVLFLYVQKIEARPLRVIYVESGELEYNVRLLKSLRNILTQLEFVSQYSPHYTHNETSQTIWQWLCHNSNISKILFLSDGYYSAHWDEKEREEIRKKIQERIRKDNDIDLILAFGTWAALDMANLKTEVPVLACAVTDAVHAGIVPSVGDSGKNNLCAIIDKSRYSRQIEYFYKIFPFTKLGLVYEDTPTGRSMVALTQIEEALLHLDAQIVSCHTNLQIKDTKKIINNLTDCYNTLLNKGVDAIYVTYNVSMTNAEKQSVFRPIIEARIPSLTQAGKEDVRNGILIGYTEAAASEGKHAAMLIREISNGAMPRSLPQYFESPIHLMINLKTASAIGWNPSLDVLLRTDSFYD